MNLLAPKTISEQEEESLTIFRAEREQAWGNRKVCSRTPPRLGPFGMEVAEHRNSLISVLDSEVLTRAV